MKKILQLVLTCMIISACSFHMEKRRYLPGYYVSISGNKTTPPKPVKEVPSKLNRVNQGEALPADIPKIFQDPATALPAAAIHPENKIHAIRNTNISRDAMAGNERPILQANHKNTTAKKNAVPDPPGMVQPGESLKNKKSSHASDSWFLALSGIFIAACAAAFKPFVAHTRKIGYWALNNRKLMRGLHFAAHCAVAGCGFYLGERVHDAGLTSSDVTTYSLAGLVSVLTVLYPHRKVKKGFFRNTYLKQKMFSLFMVLSGLLLFVNIGNRHAAGNLNFPAVSSVVNFENKNPAFDAGNPEPPNAAENDKDRRDIKILLTILTAIISFVLCVAIIGGSCALSCSGQEGLAVLLLIVGLPAVIILSIHIIKSIWQPKGKGKETGSPDGNPQ